MVEIVPMIIVRIAFRTSAQIICPRGNVHISLSAAQIALSPRTSVNFDALSQNGSLNYINTAKIKLSFRLVCLNNLISEGIKRAMNLKNIVSQASAARKLGISRAAVANLIRRGRLRTVEIDGIPYVHLSDVLTFQRQKPGPKPRAQGQARR